MDVAALTPGEYIKAADFGVTLPKTPTWTIRTANIEEMASLKPGATEKMVEKGVIYFQDFKKGWVINKTNAQLMTALFGRDTDAWAGKRVTFHAVYQPGVKQDGIQVKGSPDISKPIEAEVKLPRKRPIKVTLVPTGGNGSRPPSSTPLDEFLEAVESKLKLDPAGVRSWADAEGLALAGMARQDLLALYAAISVGGAQRASLDDFLKPAGGFGS